MESLNKTAETIPNTKLKNKIKEFINLFNELMVEHNTLAEITTSCELMQESFGKLEKLINGIETFTCGADATSERRAGAVIRVCNEKLLANKLQMFPPPPKKNKADKREMHLNLQQNFLNTDVAVKKLFNETLNKISTLMLNEFIFSGKVTIASLIPQKIIESSPFTSYLNWINSFLEILRQHLYDAGIIGVQLIDSYASLDFITASDCILLIGSEASSSTDIFMQDMLAYVNKKRSSDPKCNLISLSISGDKNSLSPIFKNVVDWKDSNLYLQNFQKLINLLYKIPERKKSEIELKLKATWKNFIHEVEKLSPEKATILLSDHEDIANALMESERTRQLEDETARNRATAMILELDVARHAPRERSTTTQVISELKRMIPPASISSTQLPDARSISASNVTPDALTPPPSINPIQLPDARSVSVSNVIPDVASLSSRTQEPSATPYPLKLEEIHKNALLF